MAEQCDRFGIKEESARAFINEFLDEYTMRGFGALSKREVEVLVMHLLNKYGNTQESSNHDLSLSLGLSEARLRNLRYDVSLRFRSIEEHDEWFRSTFFGLLGHMQLETENDRIVLVIEDKFLAGEIRARLKELGYASDTSFNSEILKMTEAAFTALLKSQYQQKDIKKIEDSLKKALKKKIEFRTAIQSFLDSAAGKAGEKIVDLAAIGLTGGISEVGNLLKLLTQFFTKTAQE